MGPESERVFNPHMGIDMLVTDDDRRIAVEGSCPCSFCTEIALSEEMVPSPQGVPRPQPIPRPQPVPLRPNPSHIDCRRKPEQACATCKPFYVNPTDEEIALRAAWAELDAIDWAAGLSKDEGGLRQAVGASKRFVKHYSWTSVYLSLMGIIGVGYETLFRSMERPSVLVLWGAVMGLPVILATNPADDEDRRGTEGRGPG
jgi:hypothetical protein